MENFDLLLSSIGNWGFPIVAFCMMFWYINKTHKELIDTVNNNTIMVQQLLEHIKGGGKENGN